LFLPKDFFCLLLPDETFVWIMSDCFSLLIPFVWLFPSIWFLLIDWTSPCWFF
jgi:hypothetical protein